MKKKNHLKNLFFITVAAALMIILYGQINYSVEPYSGWDLKYYSEIAAAAPQINTNLPQPFIYRLLGPYTVGLLPIGSATGFYVLSVLFSVALLYLFYFFLCSMEIDPGIAAFTTILFIFNKFLFGFSLWDYFQINDILSLIFLIILFWAMIKGNWFVFGVGFLLGILARETVLLMIPTALFYLYENDKPFDAWKKFTISIVPGAVVFFLLRFLIPASGESLLQAFAANVHKIYSPRDLFILLVYSFVPLSFIPFIFYEDTLSFIKKNKYALLFFALVFISSLFGRNNERLMAPAFIVFYLLIARIVQTHFEGRKLILITLLICSFLTSLHDYISRFNFLTPKTAIALSLFALAIVTIVVFVFRYKNGGLTEEKTGQATSI